MTFPPAPATEEVLDRPLGPNQWLKDHLDGLIDAYLLADTPELLADAEVSDPHGKAPHGHPGA